MGFDTLDDSRALLLAVLACISLGLIWSCGYVCLLDVCDGSPIMMNDAAAGWAQDLVVALVAVCYIVSSVRILPDCFIIMYIGTFVSYGLGAVGHYLCDAQSTSAIIAYYVVMTLAFGGDAIRAAYGYALPDSFVQNVQRKFVCLVYSCLCICASICLTYSAQYKQVPFVWAKAYKGSQIGMGLVEMSGSLAWYQETRFNTRRLGLLATAANISAWVIVKLLPLLFDRANVVTSAPGTVAHYGQVIFMWALHTIVVKAALRKKPLLIEGDAA